MTQRPAILDENPPADAAARARFDAARAAADEAYTETLLSKRSCDLSPTEQAHLLAGLHEYARSNRR